MNTSEKILNSLRWLPGYMWQRAMKTNNYSRPVHLIFALADHFEPSFNPNGTGKSYSRLEQCRRLKRWCREYPNALARWRDVDGWPLRHTYFYPAEQYDNDQIKLLAEHCHEGWGEIEIHLHHGIDHPDTSENTRRRIMEFRDALASEGCLSFEHGQGKPRFAFVHGNWALANSAGGRWCGVDNELAILSDTGCYADLTLPSAPHMSQVAKINALYECSIPLGQRAPHRRGRDLTLGRLPRVFPLIIQGPLMLNSSVRKMLFFPSIENAEISNSNPATCGRLRLWRKAGITVRGRPDWVFIKLHTHGMDPRARDALIGPPMQRFLDSLLNPQGDKIVDHVHFVTAREMVNIALAACDGCEGNPGKYRDYIFQTIKGSLDLKKT